MKFFLKLLLLFIILLAAAGSFCYSQGTPLDTVTIKRANDTGIKWMSFEEAVNLNEKAPRKIFIDVYTHWCGWCKRMDATTFQDTVIANYMNKKYYAVKLNAETKDSIRFKDKVFVYQPEYKVNELALSLFGGKMQGYPSYVFLDEKYNLLTTLAGYLQPVQLEPALKYFGDEAHKTKTWEEYQKTFTGEAK